MQSVLHTDLLLYDCQCPCLPPGVVERLHVAHHLLLIHTPQMTKLPISVTSAVFRGTNAMNATRRQEVVDTIRVRVLSGLHLGLVAYGQRLPSVREWSQELGADPRLILAAYRDLEGLGLVEVRPRSGFYVARPRSVETSPDGASWIIEMLATGIARGVPASQLPRRLEAWTGAVPPRVAVLECNEDQ